MYVCDEEKKSKSIHIHLTLVATILTASSQALHICEAVYVQRTGVRFHVCTRVIVLHVCDCVCKLVILKAFSCEALTWDNQRSPCKSTGTNSPADEKLSLGYG